MRRAWGRWAWLWGAACSGQTVDGDVPDTEPPAHSVEDTFTPTVDSEPPAPDTEVDSDPTPDSDPDSDPPLPPPTPPAWGPGLVEISGPLLTTDAFDVSPGQRDPHINPQSAAAIFADLDHDGTPEVVVSNDEFGPTPFRSEVRVYRWAGGTLTRDVDLEATLPGLGGALVSAIDLDGNDRADLVVGNATNSLYWDAPAGWTSPVSLDTYTPQPPSFPGGLMLWDLDQDGWLDLGLSDRSCHAGVVPALRTGPRAHTQRPDTVPDPHPNGLLGDATTAWRLPDGRLAMMIIGWPCNDLAPEPGFLVELGPGPDGAPVFVNADLTPSTSLWKLDPQFPNRPFTTLAPMGGTMADLDGDGILDIVIALAFSRLVVLQGMADGTFVDRTWEADMVFPTESWGTAEWPWSVVTPDLDQDGLPELVVAIGDDATSFHYLDGKTVHPKVWWNAGNWRFVEQSAALGMAVEGNWKGMVAGDPDHDGDADLLLGGYMTLPRVFRNDIATGNHGFSLRLRGTASNHLGIGAQVWIEAPGLPPRQYPVWDHANLMGLSEPMIFAGLGPNTAADVRVVWPSGYEQRVRGLAAGTLHTVVEPPLLDVTPASRHLPADGASVATITVRPHDPDGQPDRQAQVVVRANGLPLPTTGVDGVWTATVTAPSTPTTTTLQVLVDGRPMGVSPRLWWDAP